MSNVIDLDEYRQGIVIDSRYIDGQVHHVLLDDLIHYGNGDSAGWKPTEHQMMAIVRDWLVCLGHAPSNW